MKPYLISLIYITAPILIIFLYQRFKFFSKIGTVLMAYTVGIVMSLSGLMHTGGESSTMLASAQEWIMNLTVPLAIPLMLFSSNFSLWFKTLRKTLFTLIAGVLSVLIAVTAAFFIWQGKGVPDLWKVCSMLVGMYTGGTLNFASLSRILEVDNSTYILVQTFDTVLGFVLLLFIISIGYKFFRRILPGDGKAQNATDSLSETTTAESFENYRGMLQKGTRGPLAIALLLSVLLLGVGAGLSMLLGAGLNELIIILTITTLAIASSFIKKIREIPKTFELGMYFILCFSIVIASLFDLHSLWAPSSLKLLGIVGFVLVVSISVHLLLARIGKVEGDLFTVSHIALLFSPPFVPPVAAALKNRKVLLSGIIVGLIGYASGTYLGTLMAQLFKWIQ